VKVCGVCVRKSVYVCVCECMYICTNTYHKTISKHTKYYHTIHAFIVLTIVRTNVCTYTGKKTLGGDTKSSLFYILIRDYGALEVNYSTCHSYFLT
jgi:hypothetical protein